MCDNTFVNKSSLSGELVVVWASSCRVMHFYFRGKELLQLVGNVELQRQIVAGQLDHTERLVGVKWARCPFLMARRNSVLQSLQTPTTHEWWGFAETLQRFEDVSVHWTLEAIAH